MLTINLMTASPRRSDGGNEGVNCNGSNDNDDDDDGSGGGGPGVR